MAKVSDIFDVFSGSKLDIGKQIEDPDGINFVTRTSFNNGVATRVALTDDMKVYKKGDISVPLGGSLLECFVQEEDFVTCQNVHVLRSKDPNMSLEEKLFYCYALRQNKFKFVAFGREVNKYLKDIEIPDEAPEWIKNANYSGLKTKNVTPIELRNINSWKKFKCKDLFDVERGNLANLNDCADGTTPVVSAFGRNEGIQYFLDVPEKYSNVLTVSFNGSGTGYCAYHGYPFNAGADCGILLPKFHLNEYIGLFIATCINHFSYKYMYGRKMSVQRLLSEELMLPATPEGKPDFDYMEKFIRSLPYGDLI